MRPVLLEPGARFGRLTVLDRAPSKNNHAYFRVRCDCGTEKAVMGAHLRRGSIRSCGCLIGESARERFTTHGHSRDRRFSPEYSSWTCMVKRCTNQNARDYKDYGGRGITVCDRWRGDFAAFFADVGPRPSRGHTLERVLNDRGYEPGNVRWATRREQRLNQRADQKPRDPWKRRR